MPAVSRRDFKTAVIFLILGIMLGLQMSISGDHGVIAAHAHANLLGWVTMALFGTYYAFMPHKAGTRLAMIQYGVYASGVAMMTPSLYFMLQGHHELEPLVALGSLIASGGVLLFAFVVFTGDATQVSREAAATS